MFSQTPGPGLFGKAVDRGKCDRAIENEAAEKSSAAFLLRW